MKNWQKVTMLHHLILSHHGKPEFGATKVPMFAEAAVLHYIDTIDAKVFAFLEAEKEATGNWSDRQWFLDNIMVYKVPRPETGYRFNVPDNKPAPKKEDKQEKGEELSLFDK